MINSRIAKALLNLVPGMEFSVNADDYNQITVFSAHTLPSEEEVAAEIAEIMLVEANHKYKDDRRSSYPTIGDQLDMLWHAIDTGNWTAAKVKTTDFYTELKAVKDANPKPEGD